MLDRVRRARAWVVIGVLLAVAVGSASAAQRPPKASLRIAGMSPLVVKGTGFPHKKPVRVVAVSVTRASDVVRADARGRFQVALPDVQFDRCAAGLSVSARSGRVYALVKIQQLPDCAPGLGP